MIIPVDDEDGNDENDQGANATKEYALHQRRLHLLEQHRAGEVDLDLVEMRTF
jgi:hypothetical protein